MSDRRLELREEQARREVGRTEISRWLSLALGIAFVATLLLGVAPRFLILSGEVESGTGVAASFDAFARQAGAALGARFGGTVFDRNRALHRAVDDLESAVEEASWMRRDLAPGVQSVLSTRLGVGNEQVYLGGGGWLYFRASVDSLTGPPFLASGVLARRSLGGEEWFAPPNPDPLPAIVSWVEKLAERDIALLLVPTPVKASILPGGLAGAHFVGAVQNASYPDFLDRVRAAGAEVYDPTEVLLALRQEGTPVYLRADTHWRPEAVERVADALARRVETILANRQVELATVSQAYRRQAVRVVNRGDLLELLGLPGNQVLIAEEEIELHRVVDARRRLWRAEVDSPILLLGDSFSNVYSMPELGWGGGAGLAEQLSYNLGLPVDKLVVNAGGAYGARERLVGELAQGRDRLAGKRLVIWQFAQRELASGDWKLLPLPLPTTTMTPIE